MRTKHTLSNDDHPKGSQPGEWNAWDVILWLLGGWIWAGFRWYGRHHGWTRTKQNVVGIGTGFAVWIVFVIVIAATSPVEDTTTPDQPGQPITIAEPTEPELTSGQRNALQSAQSYIDGQAFSKAALIDQLLFEEFSKADAKFAANHVSANWREEAIESAEDYLDMGGFSKASLIEQLEFEGFTPAQARYAVGEVY